MYVSLQYFDAVGWVFWPVKTVSHITYTVLAGTSYYETSVQQVLGFGLVFGFVSVWIVNMLLNPLCLLYFAFFTKSWN